MLNKNIKTNTRKSLIFEGNAESFNLCARMNNFIIKMALSNDVILLKKSEFHRSFVKLCNELCISKWNNMHYKFIFIFHQLFEIKLNLASLTLIVFFNDKDSLRDRECISNVLIKFYYICWQLNIRVRKLNPIYLKLKWNFKKFPNLFLKAHTLQCLL